MIGRGLNGSALKYVLAASPLAYGLSGSSAPVWFGDFDSISLVVLAGSLSDGGGTVSVQRSATSNGTFQPFGASVAFDTANKVTIRHFRTQSSAGWYKTYYEPGSGSQTVAWLLVGQGAGLVPIEQHSTAVVLSDINA